MGKIITPARRVEIVEYELSQISLAHRFPASSNYKPKEMA